MRIYAPGTTVPGAFYCVRVGDGGDWWWDRPRTMGPEAIIAGLGLAGASVAALWRIAVSLGRYEGATAQVLKTLTGIVEDHERRLRDLERGDGLS